LISNRDAGGYVPVRSQHGHSIDRGCIAALHGQIVVAGNAAYSSCDLGINFYCGYDPHRSAVHLRGTLRPRKLAPGQ